MIVSGGQWRDSARHIHVSISPQTPLPSRLPCKTEQISLCYTVGPCWLSILNIAVCTRWIKCMKIRVIIFLLGSASWASPLNVNVVQNSFFIPLPSSLSPASLSPPACHPLLCHYSLLGDIPTALEYISHYPLSPWPIHICYCLKIPFIKLFILVWSSTISIFHNFFTRKEAIYIFYV